MICKICKIEKDAKNFHNLDQGLDNVCSQCRAKKKIALKEGKKFVTLNKEGCFADSKDICVILSEKDCFGCSFYKTIDQLDEVNIAMLEAYKI